MPKRDVEQQLEEVSALRTAAETEAAALRTALRNRVNVVVARAAKVSGERGFVSLRPDLVSAFHRLLKDGAKVDAQCWAKNALAQALKELGHDESSLFLPGAHHVQMEAVWNGSVDTAVKLRGICTLALVQCRDISRDQIFRELVTAAADPAGSVRRDAVRAIGQMGGFEAELLLRLIAGLGGNDPAVTGEALEMLIHLEGARGVEFAVLFLYNESGEIADEAALAMGASRHTAAVSALIESWPRRGNPAIIRALGLARSEEARTFLSEIAENGRANERVLAREALAQPN